MALLGGPMGPMMRSVVPTRPKPKRNAAFGGKETPDEERAELRASKRKPKRKGPPRGGYGR